LRSASRSAMLASRCFSNSESSSTCGRGMMAIAFYANRNDESVR
jgi:hypothetical protein